MFEVEAWVDGACSGNPGPMGAGVVLKCGNRIRKIACYLGAGTNNRAEMLAVVIALEALKNRQNSHVKLFTDSALVCGIFEGWRLKQNLDLVQRIKELVVECGKFEIVKVKGHAEVELNEEANRLAVKAARGIEVDEKK